MWTEDDLARVAAEMHETAKTGCYDGSERSLRSLYFLSCAKIRFGTSLIFTRDVGHHTSGWFKNPDYERCLHLSIAPAPSIIWTPDTPDLDRRLRDAWLKAFFGDNLRYVWGESPHTRAGKMRNVQHWRLFCDENWEPIKPRKEVYSRDFTEAGWKTASELGVEIVSSLEPG